MRRIVGLILVVFLMAVLSQSAGAQLPQTLDEMKQEFMFEMANLFDVMKQGDVSAVEQHFVAMQAIVGALGDGLLDQASVSMDVGRVGVSFNVRTFEVLGTLLADLQDSLVTNAGLWTKDQRMNAFVSDELTKMGDIASSIVIAGLRDSDEEVQLRSVLVFGVLLGGQADFRDLSLGAKYHDLSLLSLAGLTQLNQQFVLLKEYDKSSPKLAEKWIEVLSAISDKVHEMIEAAAE